MKREPGEVATELRVGAAILQQEGMIEYPALLIEAAELIERLVKMDRKVPSS